MFTYNVFDEFTKEVRGVSKYPPTNISYSKSTKLLFIDIALAGFQKDDIKIELEGDSIIISSNGIPEEEGNDVEYVQKSIACRSFKRIVRLDTVYVGGVIDANMENGLLTISIEPNKKHSKLISIN